MSSMDEKVISVARRKRTKKVIQYPTKKKSNYIHELNHREQGQCRCCHAEGNFRLMKMKQQYPNGNFRSYTEMLRVAFNISLTRIRINGKEKSNLICSTCEVRLRDAYNFCLHVRESEETFLIALPPGAKLMVEMESIDDSEKRDLSLDTELVGLDDESIDENAEVGANIEVIGVNAVDVNAESGRVNTESFGVKTEAVDVTAQGLVKAEPNDVNIESVDVSAERIETKEAESEKETMNALFEIEKIEHGFDHMYALFTDYDKINNPVMPMEICKELDIPKDLEIKTEPEDQNDDILVTDTSVPVKNELTTNKLTTIDLNDDPDCDRHPDIKIDDPLNTLIINFNDIADNSDVIKIEDENDETPVVTTDTVQMEIEKDEHVSNRIQIKVGEVSMKSDKEVSVMTEMNLDVAEATEIKPDLAEDFTTTIDLEEEEIQIVNKEEKEKAIMNKGKKEKSIKVVKEVDKPTTIRRIFLKPERRPDLIDKIVTVDTTKTDVDSENVDVIFEDLPQKIDYKKPFHCRYCYKRFQLRRELNAHIKDCNEIKKRGHSLKCSFCAVVVDGNFQGISEHMQSAHGLTAIMSKAGPTVKPTTAPERSSKSAYSCNKCSLGFEDLEEFQAHKKIHPVTCPKCFRTFSSSEGLKQHMTSAHPYKCRLCNDSFSNYGCFQRHRVQTHGAKYSCRRCEKVFYRHQELLKHEREQHFRTEYQCVHCDHKAPSRSELYKHILVEHKNVPENEFSCRLCEKKFRHMATLKHHFSTAHPVEPFE